jgi:CxxC motif-containing protein
MGTEERQELICINCPVGCRLTVIKDDSSDSGYRIYGNMCPRGVEYGIKESTNPTRIVTSTVKIKGAFLKRLPVKTDGAIPKGLNFKCMEEINRVVVEAPVKIGQVIIENVLDIGIDVVATRSMGRVRDFESN